MTSSGLTFVGAAFPRTGTMSVKSALEQLGIGRCYHMHEVFTNPQHVAVWDAAWDGDLPDWRNLLSGYAATLDGPACLYWREIADSFPTAKVLLLTRDLGSWYDSTYSTVYQVAKGPLADAEPALQMIWRTFFQGYFDGRFEDRDHAIAAYRRYCQEVRESVSKARLLEYQVSQGWPPLCEFLGCDVPTDPFPRRNTREVFQSRNRPT